MVHKRTKSQGDFVTRVSSSREEKKRSLRGEGHMDIFTKIEWYALKTVATVLFLVILYVAARYEIKHLLRK
jgi:hypothetical protein